LKGWVKLLSKKEKARSNIRARAVKHTHGCWMPGEQRASLLQAVLGTNPNVAEEVRVYGAAARQSPAMARLTEHSRRPSACCQPLQLLLLLLHLSLRHKGKRR
jgi:hypothetical protein